MQEEKLHNSIIISLIIGIIMIAILYTVFRPPPEYFTELYFTNAAGPPKFIENNHDYQYSFTIFNHESETKTYTYSVIAELVGEDNLIKVYTKKGYAAVPKGTSVNISINFQLPTFYKANIKTSLDGMNQEIHFIVYNEDKATQYPETVASTYCINTYKINSSNSFTITARGNYSPNMRLRIGGKEIFSSIINNTQNKNFLFKYQLNNTILDIIFDNDYFDNATKEDRNLFIESIKIGNQEFHIKDGTYDGGTGAYAFDCKNTDMLESGLYWNGALRFRFVT
jgi:hypothetical protein